MAGQTPTSEPSNIALRAYLVASVVTVAAIVAASYVPQYRAWGLAVWSHLGQWVPLIAGVVALLCLIMIQRWSERLTTVSNRFSSTLTAIAVTIGAIALFVLFRTETHFLGDGYTVLSVLSADTPLIKNREIGEAMAHVWIKHLTGLSGQQGALLSFRVISIAAGSIFVGATLITARRIFQERSTQLLFVLGMLSGGYALLFFGYVENYSLFLLTVGLFVFVGIAVARQTIPRWWIVVPLGGAIVMHGIGIALIPAAVYLLLADTRLGRSVDRWPQWFKVSSLVILAGGTVGNVYFFGRQNPFVRFALLPFVENRFTMNGYTLFSPVHLTDMANLLLLLLPSLGLMGVVVWQTRPRAVVANRALRFLLVAAVCAGGAAFLLDPKQGMARDWDLFSFIGVPLAALAYLLALGEGMDRRRGRVVALCAIVLGVLSLTGRVAVQNTPDAAVAQFRDYLRYDFVRNMNARLLLINYYAETGDTVAARIAAEDWDRDFPERRRFFEAVALKSAGKWREAIDLLYEVIERNPNHNSAWNHLGETYLRLDRLDSAVIAIEIAIGLSPYEPSALGNMGAALVRRGQSKEAEKYLLEALKLNPTEPSILYNLACAHRLQGNVEEYLTFLKRTAAIPRSRPEVNAELGDWYLGRRDLPAAAEQYRLALQKGLDSATVTTRVTQVPALEKYLHKDYGAPQVP